MKKVNSKIRKIFNEDINLRLCKKDTYVNMKLKLCNYIYNNMNANEIKNEILVITREKTKNNKTIYPFLKHLIDMSSPILISIISLLISCYTADATLSYDGTNGIEISSSINDVLNMAIYLLIVIFGFFAFMISVSYAIDKCQKYSYENNYIYKQIKLECLNKVLNIKLEELNNPKQKTDYNHKHFKVKVSSIK